MFVNAELAEGQTDVARFNDWKLNLKLSVSGLLAKYYTVICLELCLTTFLCLKVTQTLMH